MNGDDMMQLSSVERMHELMRDLNINQYLSPALLTAALQLYEDTALRELSWREANVFFITHAVFVPEGLETLPLNWLQQLPAELWHTRKPDWQILPYFIKAVAIEDGVLRIQFPQEQALNRVTFWDRLRIRLNLAMRPNLWQPLTPFEERGIWERHPQLRHELFKV